MSYRVYIKNDYKPVVRWVPDRPWYLRKPVWLVTFSIASALWLGPRMIALAMIGTQEPAVSYSARAPVTPAEAIDTPVEPDMGIDVEALPEPILPAPAAIAPAGPLATAAWERVEIREGDNLSLIFDRMGLPPGELHAVINADDKTRMLKHLLPGQLLYFDIRDKQLQAMRYEPDIVHSLEITRSDDGFSGVSKTATLTRKVKRASASIDSSLFLAGQSAQLSDNLIMRLVAIYGWDIDFAQEIRVGDTFTVVYEEFYKGDIKVREGSILAAEFVNQGRSYRTVRYLGPDGRADYYSDEGASVRKAFLRTPLKFSRISSQFDLRRRHPVLNRIRAHKGVDYAAPPGTPIKATGDGTIAHLGTKGGYGKAIIIQHGATYSTLYAHMSGYAKGVHRGGKVRQGQVIGYVGQTGLATGPHLHYEFRVNDMHRNPLTVELPKADSVPKSLMADFRNQAAPYLAALAESTQPEMTVLAMQDEEPAATVH